jgi:sterol desaturase/sphingolipid hydroxylase (fatty acid hydroxylase superfamily)
MESYRNGVNAQEESGNISEHGVMLSRTLLGGDGLGLAVLLLFLFLLAAAELWRPLHAYGAEPGGRIPANLVMGLTNAGLALLLPVSTVLAAEWAARHGVGLMNRAPPPLLVAIAATIAIRSLATYAIHRLSHRLSWLWRVHRVHHSDMRLDLSTGLRNHPLELAFVLPWLVAASLVFGLHAPTLIVYEAVALGFALWDHANLALPPRLERPLRLLFVTPAMHHVHHSAARAETDSNFGDVFSLWDRLFGTHRDLDHGALRGMRIGLGAAFDPGAASLVHQLRLPMLNPTPPSEAGEKGGDIAAERVDGIAALHHDEGR